MHQAESQTKQAHSSHNQHAGHSVAMFRDKFWLCLALTFPVVFWSSEVQHWLGYRAPTFPGSRLIPAILGTIIFVYGGRVFVQGARHELSGRQPAQAIGQAAIQQGYRVLYRETHSLLDDLAEATLDGIRKEHMEFLQTVPLLIIDDLGMRKLPLTAAEELLEIIMRRYERASTMLTSNRPVEDWGKLLGDAAAVSAMLDRLLHHGHVLKCGPRSWRTKSNLPQQEATG